MVLNIISAEYFGDYKIHLTFNNGESLVVDLGNSIKSDRRKIFQPLRNIDYFRSFKIKLNTITWPNEADFAPEFLLELGKKQEAKKYSIQNS